MLKEYSLKQLVDELKRLVREVCGLDLIFFDIGSNGDPFEFMSRLTQSKEIKNNELYCLKRGLTIFLLEPRSKFPINYALYKITSESIESYKNQSNSKLADKFPVRLVNTTNLNDTVIKLPVKNLNYIAEYFQKFLKELQKDEKQPDKQKNESNTLVKDGLKIDLKNIPKETKCNNYGVLQDVFDKLLFELKQTQKVSRKHQRNEEYEKETRPVR